MFVSRHRITLLSLALSVAAPVLAHAESWDIDSSHSRAQFAVRHLMISNVRGDLGKVTGTINWDAKNPAAAAVNATVDVAGVNTQDPKRDEHLRSPDFFDTAKYPTITFKSKRVEKAGGKLKLVGDLTLHGVTKEVALDVEGPTAEIKDPWGLIRAGANATGKISRKDFGLSWNKTLDTGGVAVGDEVAVTLDIELVRKPAGAAPAAPPKAGK
ncbi:MAG TPA: YceI family protein [Polyangia bacterium]|jgi:polyisoprenoid-binding protein YceI|nr:YceI family protein [Polyangia bacterium]